MDGDHDGRGPWDHPRLWRDEITGELVVTSEPYDQDADQLAEWLAEPQLGVLDLEVTLSGESWWNPGHTFRIMIARRGHDDRRAEQRRKAAGAAQ